MRSTTHVITTSSVFQPAYIPELGGWVIAETNKFNGKLIRQVEPKVYRFRIQAANRLTEMRAAGALGGGSED